MNTQFERLNKREREALRRLRELVKEQCVGGKNCFTASSAPCDSKDHPGKVLA